ncbi:MAG: hypothetical protein IJQ23_00320, partial [Clostridia bacterium]|nr:hypothetical protein [Clostridia bacterium]
TTKADNETLLLEQIKHLNTLIEKLESKPSTDGNNNKGLKVKIGKLQFTKKEMKEMPRLKDFSIRQKENGVYEIRFRRYGYNESFSSKDFSVAKQKAFMWLSEFEDEIRAKKRISTEIKESKGNYDNVIFGSFADNYMKTVKKKMVQPNTYASIYNIFKLHILSKYRALPLKKINAMLLQKHLTELHERIPRVAESVKTLLNNIFDYALNNGLIERNPVKAVYIPKHIRETGKALTIEEEKEFVSRIRGSRFETIYLKLLYCGCRPCELSGIQENVKDNTLTIKNGKLKSYQKILYRTIPIFPKYKPYATGKEIKVNTQTLSEEFRNFCPNHTLKDLRHTFTTRARECGIDNELVSLWTGHSLGNITASVYTQYCKYFNNRLQYVVSVAERRGFVRSKQRLRRNSDCYCKTVNRVHNSPKLFS